MGKKMILTFPGRMNGTVKVSPGFDEFRFDSLSRPHILVTAADGSKIYESDIACFKVTREAVQARGPDPSGLTVTNPNLSIQAPGVQP